MYLLENKLSQTQHVRRNLKEELEKVELLQENVIVPYKTLQNTSSNRQTLQNLYSIGKEACSTSVMQLMIFSYLLKTIVRL